MVKSLYGHPDAGGYWEKHCEDHVCSVGFKNIPNWPSCYWHERLKMFLIIYVDDFKMSGPAEKFEEAWKLIRRDSKTNKGIDTDTPEPTGKFLGCQHKVFEAKKDAFDNLPGPVTGIRVMPDGTQKSQFVTKKQARDAELEGAEINVPKGRETDIVRYIEYDMEDFFKSCVDRYLELAPKGTKLKKVTTPFIDEGESNCTDFGAPETEARKKALEEMCKDNGELSDIASKCLMKCLYGARMCRFDLLRPICALASKVTKWSKECDRKLHRLMCFIDSSLDVRMIGKVGNTKEAITSCLFSDADFAGCSETMKSTSGVFMKVGASNTHFPVSACSVKQPAVSHSTAEAEIIAAELALRKEGLPINDLLDVILERKVICEFLEDNQATIRMLESGRNPTLRHLGRTHKVDLAWLFEEFQKSTYHLRYCTSEEQGADIFTKHFINTDKWLEVSACIGHMPMAKLFTSKGAPKTGGRLPARPKPPKTAS